MAFHVTYWDYIGWKDRYANKQYDQRQRDLARKNRSSTVYTPQFVLSGDDYRRYSSFSKDVNELVMQNASVDLVLSAYALPDNKNSLTLKLKSEISEDVSDNILENKIEQVGFYFAVVENNLISEVAAGENAGEQLQHDYVVRKLFGPYFQSEITAQREQAVVLHAEWQRKNLSFVAFAENMLSGEVLQAVRLKY